MSWRRSDQDELFPAEPRKRGSGRIRIALAVLVVALGAWYLLAHYGPAHRQTQETHHWAGEHTGPEGGTSGRINRSQAPAATSAPSPGTAAPQADGDRARALISELRRSGSPTVLSRAYAEAQAFRDAGHPADAYLMYYYAARQGHAPSALALGTMADPQFFRPGVGLLDAPDMAQAYKWYRLAADQGDATARQRLTELHTRVQAAAASGDAQAQRLLLEWQ